MGCCIKPPYSQIEPGWSDGFPTSPLPIIADEWNEYIVFQLPQNQKLVTIPFSTQKASANFIPHGAIIENLVDDLQFIPSFVLVGRTVSDFTILMNQELDTDNYYFKGLISVIA